MDKNASVPFNPNIAHVFYLAGFIESWGRGVEKICTACAQEGVPQPQYEVNPSDIMIKFTAPNDRVISSVTNRVTEKVIDKLDNKSVELLQLIIEDPGYKYIHLANKLGISTKTVSIHLKKLQQAGIIERVGSDRKGYWKVIER